MVLGADTVYVSGMGGSDWSYRWLGSKQSGGASNIPGDAGAGARMDAIEDKIARLEALNEVAAEGADQKLQEAQIDAKLAQLEAKGGGMDDALEQLKAKMRAKALEEGKK